MKGIVLLMALTFMTGCGMMGKHHHGHHHKKHNHKVTEISVGSHKVVKVMHDRIYVAPQPSKKDLEAYKKAGIDLIVNLREEKEVKYNESAVAKKLGLKYYNQPLMKGDDLREDSIDAVFKIIKDNKGKKVLIHCSSGNRAAAWFGAHMKKHHNWTNEKSIHMAEQMGLTKLEMKKKLLKYLNK